VNNAPLFPKPAASLIGAARLAPPADPGMRVDGQVIAHEVVRRRLRGAAPRNELCGSQSRDDRPRQLARRSLPLPLAPELGAHPAAALLCLGSPPWTPAERGSLRCQTR